MKHATIIILGFMTMACCSKQQINIDNFNILIEDETHRIDLNKGVYEVFLQNGNQKAFFKSSKKDVESIVKYINENKFFFKDENVDFISFHSALPVTVKKITIFNSKSVSIISYCTPCYYPFSLNRVRKVEKLVQMIENICFKNDSVKKLPSSDFYLE